MYEKLFEPIKIGTLELKNRIAMAPMGTGMFEIKDSITHVPGEMAINYYAARAKGGVGFIQCEHVSAQPIGLGGLGHGEIYTDEALAGWKQVVNAVHSYGAKVSIEIGHLGRSTKFTEAAAGKKEAVSPSAVPCHHTQHPVHEMTIDEIEAFKRDYIHSVKNVVKAGFDAVQLHFANGYFLSSWLSGRTNKRTDRYGGNMENRLRFPLELIEMVRKEIGENYPLFVRIATSEANGGRGVEETKVILRAFEEAGIDMVDLNCGSYSEWDYEFPPYYFQNGFNMKEVEEIRKSLHVPVIGGGRITEPRMAEQMLLDNRVDIVQIGRALIADPEWVYKTENGEVDQIMRCIGCTRCIDQLKGDDHSLKCSVNPFVGHENTWEIKPAVQSKKILIVGGGPAGLQAAVVAAKRGHKVTLTEKSAQLGGLVRAAAVPPMKWETASLAATLANEAEKAGVSMMMGKETTAVFVKKFGADEVIVATGSRPLMPMIPGNDADYVVNGVDLLEGKTWVGKRVAIIGGGMIGCEIADFLAEYNKIIEIFEMMDTIAGDMWYSIKINMLKRLKHHDVKIHTSAKVLKFENGVITYKKNGEEIRSASFDSIVVAVGMKPVNQLSGELTDRGIAHSVIGDAVKPGRLHEVLLESVKKTINI